MRTLAFSVSSPLVFLVACGAVTAPAAIEKPSTGAPTERSAPTLEVPRRTGDVHDFDFLEGGWSVSNRTLRKSGDGSLVWDTYPATTCMTIHLGGVTNVDEFHFPTKRYSALALRVFDTKQRQWTIYWIDGRSGVLLPPVVGGFEGDRGEFYGLDEMDGKVALFRFIWNRVGDARATWEQAFSHDGQEWTVNWVMDFARDREAVCSRAEPRTRSK